MAICALSVPAIAADVPVKAAPAPAAFNWTGFYVGGDVGFRVTHEVQTYPGAVATIPELQPSNLVGGGHVGYRYQFAPNWVVGVEGDYWAGNATDRRPMPLGGADAIFSPKEGGAVLGSLGYSTGPLLIYATGGES